MSLSETIKRLKSGREAFAAAHAHPVQAEIGRLEPLDGFHNPGNLRGFCHVPDGLQAPAPLLVVLHGCTQSAAGYDLGSGWSRLADRHNFVLLYPEQRRENNPNLCFNWYQAGDSARGQGEAASIAAMIDAVKARVPIDESRIFATGLSAGGAMTSIMLAAYPELFAGGAIIAGLPYGTAENLSEAFQSMSGRGLGGREMLADRVRRASGHDGPWPRISIWHGSADSVVSPANADALVKQWTALHGLKNAPDRVESVDGHSRRVWLGAKGEEAIEYFAVRNMAHGTPLMPGTGSGQSGQAQPHMLDVGLSSTDRIAAFFGIGPKVDQRTASEPSPPRAAPRNAARPRREDPSPAPSAPPFGGGPANDVQKTIENALRSAGLLK